MITPFNIRNLVEIGMRMYKGGMFVAECAEKMSTFVTMLSLTGYGLYAVVNYTYKGSKVMYNIVTRNNSKTHAVEISEDDIPDRFKCQLTGKVMVHPVVCPQE